MVATRAKSVSVVAMRFDGDTLWAIDQTELPWLERQLELRTAEDVAGAIRRLAIRGAPLIGVAGAYGVVVELARNPSVETLERACELLRTLDRPRSTWPGRSTASARPSAATADRPPATTADRPSIS